MARTHLCTIRSAEYMLCIILPAHYLGDGSYHALLSFVSKILTPWTMAIPWAIVGLCDIPTFEREATRYMVLHNINGQWTSFIDEVTIYLKRFLASWFSSNRSLSNVFFLYLFINSSAADSCFNSIILYSTKYKESMLHVVTNHHDRKLRDEQTRLWIWHSLIRINLIQNSRVRSNEISEWCHE